MIDFANGSFVKLSHVGVDRVDSRIVGILLDDERILFPTQGTRDSVVFTNRRVIVSNVQGMTGKKVALTSLPYSKIAAFSVETGGLLDIDSEVSIWISGLGNLTFEFTKGTDVNYISKLLASVVI